MKFIKQHWLLILFLTIGTFLRFYNINWDSPFYFHPDERNIAGLVSASPFLTKESLFKGTFAYGNFLVVLALTIKPVTIPVFSFLQIKDPFSQAIIILRFFSFLFSIGTLFLIYLCGLFWSKKTGYIALFFAVFSAGLIQQAHFGTFDGYLAFCASACFLFTLQLWKTKRVRYYYFAIACVVLGAAAKINFLILASLPLLMLLPVMMHKKHHWSVFELHSILGLLLLPLVILLSPYYTTSDFRNGFQYERDLVTGKLPVFYSQSFYNTQPVMFQFSHIYPFLVNPVLTFLFMISFVWIMYAGLKRKKYLFLLPAAFYLLLFLPQAFLFTKWTRYMIPTLPFMYMIIALAFSDLLRNILLQKNFLIKTTGFLVVECTALITISCAFSFCFSTYIQQDTRIAASDWAAKHIPSQTAILSETYDIGITTFNRYFSNITLFNFYDLDTDQSNQKIQLFERLQQTRYIILPSQRVLRSRLTDKQKFPFGNKFYSTLLNGGLGFQEVYRTPCDIFCTVAYWGDPVFSSEETATVFDRPTVFIFKKEWALTADEYATVLQ